MSIQAVSDLLRPLAPYKTTAIVASLGAACILANGVLSRRVVRGRKKASTWNWDKEIVVVTGGSGGIGKELVDGFAARGVTVVSLDIKPPAPSTTTTTKKETTLAKRRGKTYFYEADVTSREAVRDIGQQIRDDLGADPTVLINNAGVVAGRPLLDCEEQSVRKVFDVNILSHFWTVSEFVPAMVKRDHGHVVSVASVASYLTLAANVEYSCTKAGVQAFHEGLGQELKHLCGSTSVLTSVVFPYWVRTPLIENLTDHPRFNAALLDPKHVAKTIVEHVMRGDRGGEIYLQWYWRYLSGIRGWPLWVQELARDAMAGFLIRVTS